MNVSHSLRTPKITNTQLGEQGGSKKQQIHKTKQTNQKKKSQPVNPTLIFSNPPSFLLLG